MGFLGNIFKKKLDEKQDGRSIRGNNIKSGNEIPSDSNNTSQTHLSSIINVAIAELEKAGYGSIKLDEFRQKVKDYTQADEINRDKDIMLHLIQNDKKILAERIRIAKINYEGEELENYLAELEQDFKDNHGHPINIQQQKKEALEELEKAGYGSIKLDEFEREFSEGTISNDDRSAVRNIQNAKKSHLLKIAKLKEDLNADINRIQHLEVGEKLNLFQELYDNDYRQNGSDYMTAYKSNLMADAKIRFQLATGHDVTSEYGDNLIQNLKLNRIRR